MECFRGYPSTARDTNHCVRFLHKLSLIHQGLGELKNVMVKDPIVEPGDVTRIFVAPGHKIAVRYRHTGDVENIIKVHTSPPYRE